MYSTPEKYDSNLRQTASDTDSPPKASFVNKRIKRKRSEEIVTGILEFKNEIKTMLSTWMSQQNSDKLQITSSLKTIEESLSFLSGQYEDIRMKMEQMERERRKDKDYITVLESKIEDMQRLNRKNAFELKNVPKLDGETKSSLISMVSKLTSSLNVELQANNILDIYRSSNKGDKKPIIVELSSYLQKTQIMSAVKKYNFQNKNNKFNSEHLGLKCSKTPVYFSDHLMQKGNRLFYLARELMRTQKYKYCWTSLGEVLVRKDENSPVIKVLSESQIKSMYETSI